jgi:hypothetical protein
MTDNRITAQQLRRFIRAVDKNDFSTVLKLINPEIIDQMMLTKTVILF